MTKTVLRNTLNVNIYAGPGVGKSVLTAQLFVALKLLGVHTEMVSEYAKELTYLETLSTVSQEEIIKEQLRRQALLQGCARVVVTDAAVPLSLAYSTGLQREELAAMVKAETKDWRSLDILLHRDTRNSYETDGRAQSQPEAQEFHETVVSPFVREYCAGSGLIEINVNVALEVLTQLVMAELGL